MEDLCCSSVVASLLLGRVGLSSCPFVVLFFYSNLFQKESAGAHPGPTCYKKGGPLTVTDANLILGRLLPEYFPKIFGETENEPLDLEATRVKFESLRNDINKYLIESGERAVILIVETDEPTINSLYSFTRVSYRWRKWRWVSYEWPMKQCVDRYGR